MPDNIREVLLHDVTLPYLIGFAGKAKDFVVTKGLVIVVTAAMTVGAAGYKLDANDKRLASLELNVTKMKDEMGLMQTAIALVGQKTDSVQDDIKEIATSMHEYFKERPARVRR